MKAPVEAGNYRAERGTDRALELIIQQLRAAVNRVLQRTVTFTSDGSGVLLDMWTDDDELSHNTHAAMTVHVLASNSDGSQYGKFEQVALFARDATAAAVQLGATVDTHVPIRSSAGVAIGLGVTASKLRLQVQDASVALEWNAWIEVRKA